MVACHNFDLLAARRCGLKTAYVSRPREWGDGGVGGKTDPLKDAAPDTAIDIVAADFLELAERLGA